MSFPPDSPLARRVVASPNHGTRRGCARPDMAILHYTGMPDAGRALNWLADPASEVSAHYFVFEDGEIVQLVPESRRAWHAGVSCWAGENDINSRSIGIEIANPGHDHGYRDFPEAQLAAVVALLQDITSRHGIPPRRVLAHSDVAPKRKRDPGERFPWERLAAAGVAEPIPAASGSTGPCLAPGDRGEAVAALQRRLARYGYGLSPTGVFDADTVAVVTAFQRRFRRGRIDGIADGETRSILEALTGDRSEIEA